MTRPIVIKLGGRALEAPQAERELARDLEALRAPAVVVHGGGAEVTAWCDRLGLGARFENGLRVTDAGTLDVAVAVLAGLANQRLVARLREAGLDAVGIAAVSGGLAAVAPHPRADRLGAVGTVTSVRPALLDALLEGGFVPVVSSVGARDGSLLNVNADELAGALAGALRSRALVLLTDVPGVSLGLAPVARLSREEVDGALASPHVRDGMVPKLVAAARALDEGCARGVIGRWSGPGSLAALLHGHAPATTIVPGAPLGAAPADAGREVAT